MKMMLRPNAISNTCERGCCGGKNDFVSVKAARRAVRRIEKREWKKAI